MYVVAAVSPFSISWPFCLQVRGSLGSTVNCGPGTTLTFSSGDLGLSQAPMLWVTNQLWVLATAVFGAVGVATLLVAAVLVYHFKVVPAAVVTLLVTFATVAELPTQKEFNAETAGAAGEAVTVTSNGTFALSPAAFI